MDIYDPAFVAGVFDRCSARYRRWSQIASFGLIARWRVQCVAALDLPRQSGATGVDLMAGTGEVWPALFRRFPNLGPLTAIDISQGMHDRAVALLHQARATRVTHLCDNVLETRLAAGSAGFAISTFGLKTFNKSQHLALAQTLSRTLAPGAPYAFIEATDPMGWALRPLYRAYLDTGLPILERTLLRGAEDFQMIGPYTRNFGKGETVTQALEAAGLAPRVTPLFGGTAQIWAGRKPA